MYGFLIKKSFCDDWDNLLTVVLVNLVTLFSGLILLLGCANVVKAFGEESTSPWLLVFALASLIVFCIVFSIINLAFAEVAAKIADFNIGKITEFFKAIPGVLKDAVLFGLLNAALIIISVYCIDFYILKMSNMFGLLIGAFIFWLDLFIILALQWFAPIRATMHNDFKKCLKKCMIILFDNTGFSIFMLLHSAVMLVLSVFLVGLFPSIAGIMISKCNALRIRLYKYDYLEQHPELQTKRERKQIPWDELLFDDRDMLGPRKLKSFIFPWKE